MDEMRVSERRTLDLMNAQWATQTTVQLRPSTVIFRETITTSQIRWRQKAREHEAEQTKREVERAEEETPGRGIDSSSAKAVVRQSARYRRTVLKGHSS